MSRVSDIVARCEAAGCCPLGAAINGWPKVNRLRKPHPEMAVRVLALGIETAEDVADAWDGVTLSGRKARVLSMRLALAAGLGPRILAGLARIEGER